MAQVRHPYVPPKNQRLDLALYALRGQAGFFTVRAYGATAPFATPALNDAVVDLLLTDRLRLGVALYVYCLMPDHLHILIGPQEDGQSMLTFVDQFKGKSTRVAWGNGCVGKLWQKRSYDHLVRKDEEMLAIARYVLDNPVRAGLVTAGEEYPWAGIVDPMPM